MTTTATKVPQAKWYLDLCSEFDELMDTLEIHDDAAEEIKTFVLDVARNQYLAGNRSGIRWAREQAQGQTQARVTVS